MSDKNYYRQNIFSKIAIRYSISARQKMIELFFKSLPINPSTTVLDLGVSSENHITANFFEKMFPYPEKLTCAGIEDAFFVEKEYPGVKFVRIEAGRPLPFRDQEFDIVHSNAVLEHVGSLNEQCEFITEVLRVSKAFFITTPNRWFPVEPHTFIPLIHLLPKRSFRYLLNLMGDSFYAQEKNLNLLSQKDILKLFPKEIKVNVALIRTIGFASNIIVYGTSL
jgi:SAM-dependent methyltransferase